MRAAPPTARRADVGGTMQSPAVALVEGHEVDAHRVALRLNVRGVRTGLAIWYPTVDLARLSEAIGAPGLERILAHVAALEAGACASLGVDEVDLGPLRRHVDEPLGRLWEVTQRQVFAQ